MTEEHFAMLESCVNLEPGIIECEEQAIFDSDEPLWLLGTSYDTRLCMDSVKTDITSRIWLTYRRHFPAIDWRWLRDKDDHEKRKHYLTMLRMFQDKKDRLYSLHQIAQMGASEGRTVGSWFGPNTVSQVLRKLAAYDDWSKLAVHVAMDSLLIDADVRKTVCRRWQLAGGRARSRESSSSSPLRADVCLNVASSSTDATPDKWDECKNWCPLLILIPLRLGLTSFNICYIEALEACFKMPQCAGMIGGRPNHALYFLGCCGTKLIYLDPHQCQDFVDLDVSDSEINDESYHCPFLLHMDVRQCDPSVALGFFCDTLEQYQDLVARLKNAVLPLSTPVMFEVIGTRPDYMPQWDPYPAAGSASPTIGDYAVLEGNPDTDDEFEVLGGV